MTDAAAAQQCLEPEDVAAFVDGRLFGPAREAVLLHIAECERCHELFTETSRALLEEEGALPARAPRRWLMPALAAAGIILAAATSVLLLRGPGGVDVAGLVDPLSARDAAAHVRPAPVMRGGASDAAGGAGVAIGALLVDLRVAADAGDEERGRLVLHDLATRLRAVGLMDEEERLCAQAAARFDPQGWSSLSRLLEERAGDRFPSPAADLGKFLEAGRLAAATRAQGFFSPSRRAVLVRLRSRVDDAALRARLDAVLAAWDAPGRPLDALERAFSEALIAASRSPAP